jgi:hypothetical protein
MILNEDLRFDAVDASVKRAFLRPPEKLLLSARTHLYKWTDGPLDQGGRVSPWWSFVETTQLPSGVVADGFRVSEERARRIGRTHRELARARAAISGEFKNRLSNLLVIELAVPVWGFAGAGERSTGVRPQSTRTGQRVSHWRRVPSLGARSDGSTL